MRINNQDKNSFSFKVKILDNDNNYKKIKDIFIRKQDIYLIKLLEKRIKKNKNNLLYKSMKKNIFYDKDNNFIKYEMNQPPQEKKLLNYKNIRIIKRKLDNSDNSNNYILENNNKNQFEDFITSKIYNSDSSRNNKTMLNAKIEKINFQDNNYILKTIFERKNKYLNDLKTSYNKTALNLNFIHKNNIFPYSTNHKLKKILNYTKCNQKSYNNGKYILNDNKHYEKPKKNKNRIDPIYTKIFQNLNDENQNNTKILNNINININQKLNNSNNKENQFHNVFNLFKKNKQLENIKNIINIKNNVNKGKINYRNDRNKSIINYSLNKYGNAPSLDVLFNELPYINKVHNVD